MQMAFPPSQWSKAYSHVKKKKREKKKKRNDFQKSFNCTPGEMGDIEAKRAMFCASTVKAADPSCCCKVISVCCGGDAEDCRAKEDVIQKQHRLAKLTAASAVGEAKMWLWEQFSKAK